MMTSKKPLQEIINDKFPSLKVSMHIQDGEWTIFYDAYAAETEIEEMKDLLKELKVDTKIERRVF